MKPESIVPITEPKRDSGGLIERATEERNQDGRATVVVQDIRSSHAERQAFAMLALCMQGQRDIAEGRTVSHGEHRKRIDEIFKRFTSKQ